jgi:hypothetical protein
MILKCIQTIKEARLPQLSTENDSMSHVLQRIKEGDISNNKAKYP